ncbi:MAG: outer membrane lipoprotein chaperone LolA [Pseudomonadota bacterium]
MTMNGFLIAAAALILAPFGAAAGDTLDDFVRDVTTLSAGFTQEVYSADDELLETARGRVAVRRPGRLHWSFDEPEQLIVADGRSLWIYDIELDQITVSDQRDELAGSPAALLGGDADALSGFEVIERSETGGIDWTRLRPKDDGADFESLSIGFRDGCLYRMQLRDGLGQTTLIGFTDVVVDGPLADGLFRFEVPAGADVIDRREPAVDQNDF